MHDYSALVFDSRFSWLRRTLLARSESSHSLCFFFPEVFQPVTLRDLLNGSRSFVFTILIYLPANHEWFVFHMSHSFICTNIRMRTTAAGIWGMAGSYRNNDRGGHHLTRILLHTKKTPCPLQGV